jgi:hypothetical protein
VISSVTRGCVAWVASYAMKMMSPTNPRTNGTSGDTTPRQANCTCDSARDNKKVTSVNETVVSGVGFGMTTVFDPTSSPFA